MASYQVTIAIKEEIEIDKNVLNELQEWFDIEKTIDGVRYWYVDNIGWYGLDNIHSFLFDLSEEDYGAVAMSEDWEDVDMMGDFFDFDIYPGLYPFGD